MGLFVNFSLILNSVFPHIYLLDDQFELYPFYYLFHLLYFYIDCHSLQKLLFSDLLFFNNPLLLNGCCLPSGLSEYTD